MGTVSRRGSRERFILPWTSQKGMQVCVFSCCCTCVSLWASKTCVSLCKWVCNWVSSFSCVMLLRFDRYICSSGENEPKSVMILFDDYLKSWVCGALNWQRYDCVLYDYEIWVSYQLCRGILVSSLLGSSSIFRYTYYNCLYLQGKNHPGIPTPRLFTVGRLDVATTGLIIVTNDGMWFHVKAI